MKDFHKFNLVFSGYGSRFSADGVIGIKGLLVGFSVAHVFKKGESINIIVFCLKVSICGDVMAGGIGYGCLLEKKLLGQNSSFPDREQFNR